MKNSTNEITGDKLKALVRRCNRAGRFRVRLENYTTGEPQGDPVECDRARAEESIFLLVRFREQPGGGPCWMRAAGKTVEISA